MSGSSSDVVELARPEDVQDRPTIALCLLLKNAESVVGRLLDCVGPYISEVSVVLNDTSDNTWDMMMHKAAEHGIRRISLQVVTADSHPEHYIMDRAETYQVGESLCGEIFEQEFTNRPILADWAATRNLEWKDVAAKWRLMLDADDVVDDPGCLPGLCRALEALGVQAAASRYHYDRAGEAVTKASAFRERLAINDPKIVWSGVVHECLAGYDPAKVAHVEGNLVVRDMRDSTGRGIRVPGRNLKVLYHRGRSRRWALAPREMIYLGVEARHIMPTFAVAILNYYLDVSAWMEERAWAASTIGEIREAAGDLERAADWYERACEMHPGVLSAMRLSRVRFAQGAWQACVDAYALGITNQATPQLLDAGDLVVDAAQILVASALRKLGRYDEAVEMCRQALLKFPNNAALLEMAPKMEKKT